MAAAAAASSSSKRKQAIVCVSSSSSSDDEHDDESDEGKEESESEFEPGSEDESGEEEDPVSENGSRSSDDDADEDDFDDDGDGHDDSVNDEDEGDDDQDSKGKPTDEEYCNKVINLLRGRKHLDALKLEECKAYLRKHELRISGTKATCIKRILEHWRIKDGNGTKLYPESSFIINCTGDVCRGDVVMFKQRVYEKFDIVKRGGGARILGNRVVAGRVVKESYGSSKQQHTFSIEVLWSKGVKALPPLFPLLVKGRNLYRMKTFRQPWSNEEQRSLVLAEKHRRGAAARQVRAIAKAKAPYKGSKSKKKSSTTKEPRIKKRKGKMGCAAENVSAGNKLSSNDHKRKRNVAQTTKLLSSATNCHAKLRKMTESRNLVSSAMHPEQSSHHPYEHQRVFPYPHRYPYNEFSRPPVEVFGSNYMGVPQAYTRTHDISYNLGYASSAAVLSHGHIQHSYNAGFVPYMHIQTPNVASNVSHAYGNPAFPQQPRRLDDGASGGQFHGWRRL